MTRKIILGIVRYLCLLLAALIVGCGIYSSIASNLGGNKFPMPFGIGMSAVISGSMDGGRSDSLSVGDLIIVKERGNYAEDDVVVYLSGRMTVVHRIVKIDGERVITKGDANNAEDEAINISDIKGAVICSVPFIGYVVIALKSPIGVIITICLAVGLLELSYRRVKKRNAREEQSIKDEIEKLTAERKRK